MLKLISVVCTLHCRLPEGGGQTFVTMYLKEIQGSVTKGRRG